MARSNDEVAALFQEYADLISITGGDAYRTRVYEKAARSIGGYHTDVATLDLKGLQEIPNVGKSTAEKIVEYFRSGSVSAVEELRSRIPAGVRRLTEIPMLGPKKACVLYEELGISSVEELADAIHEERLRDLKGFGPKTVAGGAAAALLAQGGGGALRRSRTPLGSAWAECPRLRGSASPTFGSGVGVIVLVRWWRQGWSS